ncbi:MAG: hypothetical protein M0010_22015 [Actinomycetota bacterium]|nr:hypothetical protein [Actinomycetota bacterium]
MSAAGRDGGPGVDSGLFDELFPLDPAPAGRRRRPTRIQAASPSGAPPASTATPETRPAGGARPGWPRSTSRSAPGRPGCHGTPGRSSWHRAAVVGLACAVLALVVRLVLVHVLPADVHRLSDAELGLGALGAAVVAAWCARFGVPVLVCGAVVLAASSIDLAAPVGIGLVFVAVLASRGDDEVAR